MNAKKCNSIRLKKYYNNNKDKWKNEYNESRRKRRKKTNFKADKEYYRKNKDTILKKQKVYCENNKEKIAKRRKKWFDKNKEKVRKYKNKWTTRRRRNLGYFELWSNPFPKEIKVDFHHINNLVVIPIPNITHRKTLGKKHREKCNKKVEEIYMIDLKELLNGTITC